MEPLILCCYIIKVVLLLHFHSEKGLNPFLFKPVYGKFHWDIPFATRTEMTLSKSSMWGFEPFFPPATLLRTLNRTFHSLTIGGAPLMMTEKEKFHHTPLWYHSAVTQAFPWAGNQTWLPAGGWCWRSQAAQYSGYVLRKQGSHSKLSHLWSLLISPKLNLWPR